jgi:hypothetical protein
MAIKFFVPCYLGSNIEFFSQNYIRDVYHGVDWINGNKKLKADLRITQECLKKGLQLKVAKVVFINLETFIRVLNFSFSVYAVLNHINYSSQ